MTIGTNEIASELIAARHAGHQLAVNKSESLQDLAAGYAIQQQVIAEVGDRLTGWKIGATNPRAQSLLATDRPFYGPLLQSWCHQNGAALALVPGLIGIEIEIAFVLAQDLPSRDEPYEKPELLAAIGSVHPAVELVGTRFLFDGLAPAPITVADFGGNYALVSGEAIENGRDIDLAAIEARCLINGEEKAKGMANSVLGGPLKSLAWFADEGPGMKKGQIISTGTITGLTKMEGEGTVSGDFGSLGAVELRLSS